MSAAVSSSRAFDALAPVYDRHFTETALGRLLRARVWERLEETFSPGQHVLELNCGTGEDACFLAERGIRVTATDGSRAMLAIARAKAESRGLSGSIRFETLDLENPTDATRMHGPFDGVFSNFGGLNCVDDLRSLGDGLATWLRPETKLILVTMGPLCLWETLPALARGDARGAFRRWRKKAHARIGGETIEVSYRWPSETAAALGGGFELKRVEALGVFLPPSLWSRSLEERPYRLHVLRSAERGLRRVWPFRHLGDHHIIELVWNGARR